MTRDPFEDAPAPGALGPDQADYGERDAGADAVMAELVNEQAGDDDELEGVARASQLTRLRALSQTAAIDAAEAETD